MTQKNNAMANEKRKQQLDDLTEGVSKFIGKPCMWLESDLGGAFQIYTVEHGVPFTNLFGTAKYDILVNRFAIFQLGWSMAKEKYDK
ncbi:MAG: hypothetical protein II937_09610 [Bacteroidales bacterium]|nr:hypothetical protein [Bacteroidales bacterium]